MFNGQHIHVGDVHRISPLLSSGGLLRDRHDLANRRHAFSQRSVRKVDARVTCGGVSRATVFRKRQGNAKLKCNQLALSQRQDFFLDVITDVGAKATRLIYIAHLNLQIKKPPSLAAYSGMSLSRSYSVLSDLDGATFDFVPRGFPVAAFTRAVASRLIAGAFFNCSRWSRPIRTTMICSRGGLNPFFRAFAS